MINYTTRITLIVSHTKPLPDLAELAAGRAYTLDGVSNVTLENYSVPVSVPADCDVRKIMLSVEPGDEGMGEEVYAKSVADVEEVLGKMGEELEDWQLGIKQLVAAPQPQPVQIESLPTPDEIMHYHYCVMAGGMTRDEMRQRLVELLQPVQENECRCEPSDYVQPADYDGDGSVDGLARRAEKDACDIPPAGWRCIRVKGHEGPCAALQDSGLDELAKELAAETLQGLGWHFENNCWVQD